VQPHNINIAGLSYLIATLKGTSKPNRVTWFLWTLAAFIAFTAEVKQGVGLPALMTFMVAFNPLLIFIASFANKKAEWKLGRFDYGCGALALLGIALWMLTSDANLAIIFAILADGIAGIPTIVKAYRFPDTENYLVYLFGGINAAITLLRSRTGILRTLAFRSIFLC
jgi:hypothetical protein